MGVLCLKALGDYLRQAREAKGISLQEVQEKTKIRQYYLEAIEDGNFEAIPGEVYQKGFIRNYAAVVGLDEQDVINRYNQLKEAKAVPEQPVAAPEPVSSKPKPQAQPVNGSKSAKDVFQKKLFPYIILTGLVLVAVGGWMLVGKIDPKVKPKAVVSATTSKPITIKSVAGKKTDTPSMTSLRLKADSDVWIRLTEKETGNLIEEVTLHKGDTREWKLDRKLELLNGNAGSLLISILGGPFKVYGDEGQVVRTTYTPQGVEKKEEN